MWNIEEHMTSTGQKYLSYICPICNYEIKVFVYKEGPENEAVQREKMRQIKEHDKTHDK
jgi:hypothetical protein